MQRVITWYRNYTNKDDPEVIAKNTKVARPSRYKKVYTDRDVVKFFYKNAVSTRAEKKGGDRKGSKAYLKAYAKALSHVIDKLSEEDYQKVRDTTEEWNSTGPPPHVQLQ